MRWFILLALFLGVDVHAQIVQHEPRFIQRVRVVAYHYSAMPIVGTTPKMLLKEPWHWARIDQTIYDPGVYLTLDSLIRDVQLDSKPKLGNVIDARVTCLVYREHGCHDTVSFGGPAMQINERVGFLQPGVLLTIGKYLPRVFEIDIRYYLDTIWMRQRDWPKYGYKTGSDTSDTR